MNISSEYTFPIFISSTDYNLKDLRAELSNFLIELGYRPILSSAEGFPDNYPSLEPWESCLPVLEKCFVVLLIIDGRYGQSLKWRNLKNLKKDVEISPTHGEYKHAHHCQKRMLVFIRSEIVTLYNSFKKIYYESKRDIKKTKKLFSPILPHYIDFNIFPFLNEIKTTKPIPWIKEFNDVTEIKSEVQKKMLNELAEIFMIKEKRLEIVVDSFNKAMETLDAEEQQKILTKINANKEFVQAFSKLKGYQSELKKLRQELKVTENSSGQEKKKFEKRIKELEKEIQKSEFSDKTGLYIQNGNIRMGTTAALATEANNNVVFSTHSHDYNSMFFPNSCEKCHGFINISDSNVVPNFKHCYSCNRNLCYSCWPTTIFPNAFCPDCEARLTGVNFTTNSF